MTNRLDAARGRDIVARWCNLAEQRLDHLTELFESGRWRRYHSEHAFLENIQEAKKAVETWRDLLAREDIAVDISSLSQRTVLSARGDTPAPQIVSFPQRAAPSPAERPRPAILAGAEIVRVAATEAPAVLAVNASAFEPAAPPIADTSPDEALESLDITLMQRRYPLLRNAL
jgi:uncharacterized repeat protein (TIGR03809 family)